MSLLRQHKHVESLSGSDQGIDNPDCVSRMDIVIYVTMYKEKMALKVLRDLRISGDLVYEGGVTLVAHCLLDSVMGLAPPSVVDIVVMVAGA